MDVERAITDLRAVASSLHSEARTWSTLSTDPNPQPHPIAIKKLADFLHRTAEQVEAIANGLD